MKIEVYSHCFMVTDLSRSERTAVESYIRQNLVQYEMVVNEGRKEMIPTKEYASTDADKTYVRFHINFANEFLQAMAFHQVPKANIHVFRYTNEVDPRCRITLEVKNLPPPRGPQPESIAHILAPGSNKIITLQPGLGKTHIAKCCVNHLQLRSAFFMKSSFIDRWIPDMEDSFHYGKGELLEVAGSAALNSVMEMALEGELTGKCVFFSIRTYSDYLNAFERQGVSQMFPIAPIDFFHRMGFGFSVLDEGHQFPHQIMKLFSYTHVPKFVTLSATLDTQNKFNNRMYEIMYPRAQRFDAGFYDAFIVVTEILYQLKIPNSIRCSGFQGAYSHTAFEASLMLSKNRHILKNYLELVAFYVNKEFVSVYEKGQKGLVFCATIKFCTLVSSFLAKRFPQIDVQRYVSKDKPSVLANAEFIVSTVLSAGTAIDIPNLLWGFMTIALDSQQSNEQTLGRTRRLKSWPNTDAKFSYLVCQGIPKHVQYSMNKKKFFQGKVKAHLTDMSPISV